MTTEVAEKNVMEWVIIVVAAILALMIVIFFSLWLLCKIGVTC
jgi:uncharacterized integral membrane protein